MYRQRQNLQSLLKTMKLINILKDSQANYNQYNFKFL